MKRKVLRTMMLGHLSSTTTHLITNIVFRSAWNFFVVVCCVYGKWNEKQQPLPIYRNLCRLWTTKTIGGPKSTQISPQFRLTIVFPTVVNCSWPNDSCTPKEEAWTESISQTYVFLVYIQTYILSIIFSSNIHSFN